MEAISEAQMMLAVAAVFGLAMVSQIVAPLLRLPALILLLPIGFTLGLVAPQLRVDQILGPVFPVVVNLIVALILFQGGLELSAIRLDRTDKVIVRRLVWLGGAITFLGGSLAVHYILDFSWALSFLLGAILIVSGPTVVNPILTAANIAPRARRILMWEGTTLDPIGAIFAVVVFQLVKVSDASSPFDAILPLIGSFLVAIFAAVLGVGIIVLGMRLVRGRRSLGTQVLVGAVIVSASLANFFAEDSGLLAALLVGVGTPLVAKWKNESIEPVMPFFSTISSLGIGVLFISISAMVPSPTVLNVLLPALGVAAVLVLIVRPVVAAICTARSSLSFGERAFIGWMDPRGIVAAATASSVGTTLVAAKVPGAGELLPAAFIVIAATVFIYGLTAVPVAKVLGVRQNEEP